jgi:integrase
MRTLSKNDVRYWQDALDKHKRKAKGASYTDSDYSVRIHHGGRRERFQLGTANKYEAAAKARKIYQSLVANGWDETLTEFKAAKAPRKIDVTIGEFLAELKSLHASKAKTLENYAGSLRRIAAWVAGIPSGGRGGNADSHCLWREKVDELKLGILSRLKIQKWKESFLSRAGTDPLKQRAARVSVNSFLREARSLFSPKYLEGLETICLPAPLPFTGIKLEKRSMPRYQSTFDVLELVRAASDELATSEPEQFKAFVLAVMAGLRRNEIDKLEWNRFNWSAGTINITPTEFFRTKSDDSTRGVWIPPEMLEVFQGYHAKAQSRFVIESDVDPIVGKSWDHYRCQAIFDKLIAWLRDRGVDWPEAAPHPAEGIRISHRREIRHLRGQGNAGACRHHDDRRALSGSQGKADDRTRASSPGAERDSLCQGAGDETSSVGGRSVVFSEPALRFFSRSARCIS